MIPAWTLAMMEPAQAGSSFTPLDLGSKLKAWWAPPEPGVNVTLNGSAIADWTDEVGAYVLGQATGASRPLYDASSFAGLACAEFDGSNDHLALAPVPAGIPSGSTACEMWLACRQDADPATDVIRAAAAQGGNANLDRRFVASRPVSGTNRARATVTNTTTVNLNVDFSSAHTVRAVFGATARVDVDGVAGSDTAITLNTDTTRLVMGAESDLGADGWLGGIRQFLITEPLTAGEAASMLSYLSEGL